MCIPDIEVTDKLFSVILIYRKRQVKLVIGFLYIYIKDICYVAFSPENGKIKLAFLPQNKDYVLHCLYPDKHQAESDELFSVTRNSKVNTRLKSEALQIKEYEFASVRIAAEDEIYHYHSKGCPVVEL